MKVRLRILALAALASATLPGCGFTPLYATDASGRSTSLANIHIDNVSGSDEISEQVYRAFSRRAGNRSTASYDLTVSTQESARRLAVQIDSTVTRYNYNLRAKYRLVERATGKAITGSASAVTSFNIVSSQYSTLFAENAAREKAALALVDDIERDILLRLVDEQDDS